MRMIGGTPIPDGQVDAWVDEAEAGYAIAELRRRGRPGRGASATKVIPVRLTVDELAALESHAKEAGLNRSEAIRQALDAWVSA